MIGRLNHVAIAVPDLTAAADQYRSALGAKVGMGPIAHPNPAQIGERLGCDVIPPPRGAWQCPLPQSLTTP